ncbi:MAG: hypothetical protein PHW60_02370 [Kiritimatiellae bacterium]|nr:hypothetical protein [Kiritimatiellia bacterium]
MRRTLGIFIALLFSLAPLAGAKTKDLGNGFADHGVGAPVSVSRGMVATVDGQGRDVALILLYDHRGGYALLMIDADTGRSEQFPMPFDPGHDAPFASLLSSGNKYYAHFNSYFCEFDPVQRAFTFSRKTASKMAMSMTEDDQGVIWSVTYPQSGVVAFNPKTRKFKDYGHVYKQNWAQYPSPVAADDAGWIYFAIGSAACQIIAFDPKTARAKPIIPEAERIRRCGGYVYRSLDGKVYGRTSSTNWYEFYKGEGRKIVSHKPSRQKPVITGNQGLSYKQFPDGRRLTECNLDERVLVVEGPKTNETKRLHFDYASEGLSIMSVAAAPDGTICGGTSGASRFFSYNPGTDELINRNAYKQWNTLARQGDRFFVGGYTGGFLLEWDPARAWVPTETGRKDSNPLFLGENREVINRPHKLLAHPDGKTLVLAGTPGYGATGGGLVFWDRPTTGKTQIAHTSIIPEHSTMSLVALPGGKLLGGTTTRPGTGGEKKANEAELYIMDMATKKVEWHAVVFPGAQGYTDMCLGSNGLVYGFTDRVRFFAFDPAGRKVVHKENTGDKFGPTASEQGSRVFVCDRDGAIYILFVKGIARLDPATLAISMLAESPVPVMNGGDVLEGRIYFMSGSHVYSFSIPDTGNAARKDRGNNAPL